MQHLRGGTRGGGRCQYKNSMDEVISGSPGLQGLRKNPLLGQQKHNTIVE